MKYTIVFAALLSAAMAVPLAAVLDAQISTSERQAVTYTDENGVEYYQDASEQWYYYPSPSPSPAAVTPEPASGSSVALESGTEAAAKGDTSVSVAADEESAGASGNGLNAVLAAALASPGTPSAFGFAF